MKQALKSTIFAAALILLVVGLISGVLSLVSYLHQESPEELYSFVVEAKAIQATLVRTTLLSNIETLIESIPTASFEDTTQADRMIRQGIEAAHAYREDYYGLAPTKKTLTIYKSLCNEINLMGSCYGNLNLAWTAKKSGDSSLTDQYINIVEEQFQKLTNLIAADKMELDALLLDVEPRLN